MSKQSIEQVRRILEIFQSSEGEIRPHFILTGPSGSGKSHTVETLVEDLGMEMLTVNTAQLTKEGTSGNSLSKALAPLMQKSGRPVVVFADEFDKLFISGNSNGQLAHEVTHGVQNEFLKVLEGKSTSVYGDFGKYLEVRCDNTLFIFAGAFNGEENIDIDRLRDFGIKTEFLGRVGLTFAMEKISLEMLKNILEESSLLKKYLVLFPKVEKPKVVERIMEVVTEAYEKNTLGVRLINTLIHQYFINGDIPSKTAKKVSFQKTLSFDN